MKIGIITFHFAFNQGAVLQCCAMQKYLESKGHEAYVIDYRPKYHTVMHAAWRDPIVYSGVFWKKFKDRKPATRSYLTARSFLRCMYWNLSGVDRKNQKAFLAYDKKSLNLTDEYRTLEQLQSSPPAFDAYISGSDQVWNPDLTDQEFDRAYFLDFGAPETRRITYAVSMGKNHTPETLLQLKELCKGLDAVSIREYSREDIDAIGRDVHICIDPTLLLREEQYADVEDDFVPEQPYIFAYGFETNPSLIKAVQEAVRKYNCRVINGSPKWLKLKGAVDVVSGYGPDRFLSLIKNAECVVTNSFHGTAFSIIYKKDFITVAHSTRGKRMTDLLCKLGLSHRLYGREDYSFEKPVDYDAVDKVLDVLRSHSGEYLELALAGKKGEEIPHHPEDETGHDI